MAAARTYEYGAFEAVLYLGFELNSAQWKLGFTTGPGRRPRRRMIEARDLKALKEEIHKAKKKFDLPGDPQVLNCYEAGGDSFSRKDPGTV
jgi:hypothetical protein